MPEMGRGRPIFPVYLLKDKKLAKQMKEAGLRAVNKLQQLAATRTRTDEENPQTVLADLKKNWMKLARTREKQTIPRMIQEVKLLESEIKAVGLRLETMNPRRHGQIVRVRVHGFVPLFRRQAHA